MGNETKELTSCFLYWFVGKDYSTPSHLQRTLRTTWDLLFHHLNHRWAYVIVSAQVLKDSSRMGKASNKQWRCWRNSFPNLRRRS